MTNRTVLRTAILSMLFAAGSSYAPSAPVSTPKRVPFFVNIKETPTAVPVPPQTQPPPSVVMTNSETSSSNTVTHSQPQAAQSTKPETSVKQPKKAAASAKKGGGNHKSTGPFAPLVLLTKDVLGEEKLNKIRAKAISLHSDAISTFVDTADSATGQRVLQVLFNMADTNKDGTVDEEELATALQRLGFDHLKPKQVAGIFARADTDDSGTLDYDEWKAEAPKTLRTNLIKLAKSNGGELGFLA